MDNFDGLRATYSGDLWLRTLVLVCVIAGCGDDAEPIADSGVADSAILDASLADAAIADAAVADARSDSGQVEPPDVPVVPGAPRAQIDEPAADTTIAMGGTVAFSGSCTDPEGDALTHAWDFADAGVPPSPLEDPGSVVFDTPGVFTVTYTCTDADGLADPAPPTRTITVRAAWYPIVGDFRQPGTIEVGLVDLNDPASGIAPLDLAGWPNNRTRKGQLNSNGRYYAFVAPLEESRRDGLFVLDLTAAAPVAVSVANVPAGSDVRSFLWSPDGNKLAYSRRPPETPAHELFVLDLSAGLLAAPATEQRLHGALPEGAGFEPSLTTLTPWEWSWSSDSTRFYFLGDYEVAGVNEAFVFELASGRTRRLHPRLPGNGEVVALDAVGPSIVLIRANLTGSGFIDIAAVDSAAADPLAAVRLNPTPAANRRDLREQSGVVSVSPDFTRAVFRASTETGRAEFFYVDFSGGIPSSAGAAVRFHAPLTSSSAGIATWSPTDNRLVYTINNTGTSSGWYVDLSGATPAAPQEVVVRPNVNGVLGLHWNPNGQGFAFDAFLNEPITAEVFYVPVSDTGAGSPVVLNPPVGANDAYWIAWLRADEALYRSDMDTGEDDELFRTDVSAPGTASRVHGSLTQALRVRSISYVAPRHLLVLGTYRRPLGDEAFYADANMLGTHIPLGPLLGAGQEIDFIP